MATILIVDDEKVICEEFRDILIDDDHEVDVAFSGEEALQKFQDKEYDLIFLDVLMPRMEGRQVFEEFKKIRNSPVAIMSGYIPPNKEREVLALGAVACLRKPLNLERVRSLIGSIQSKS